ncbi:hypothetical protein V1527DRAFT_462307 [Lipomyces starkeyi]
MAANFVAAYSPDRAGPIHTAATFIQQQQIPVAPLQYHHKQPAMAMMPRNTQQMQMQIAGQQQRQQQQPQQFQQSHRHQQQLQEAFIQQQQYLEQQYAHDPLTAAYFAADPIFSNTAGSSSNDYISNNDDNNSNNAMLLNLLANDLASSISADPISADLRADLLLCPRSPNHRPPDFSRVQRISEQYMRTGDAPYIASAALFQGGWDGLEGWNQPSFSQVSQQSSIQRSSQMPASRAYSQQSLPLNPRQVASRSSPSTFGRTASQQPDSDPVNLQNGYKRPQQQQPIHGPVPQQQPPQIRAQFQPQPSVPMLPQELQQLRSVPQQHVQQQPSPPQQFQHQRSLPEDSFEFSKINWSDLQASILNAPAGSASHIQASGLISDTGHPPINQLTPVSASESPVIAQTWRGSPVPNAYAVDQAISANNSLITPGGVFHPHQRAASFPVHAIVPTVQRRTSPAFLAERSKVQVVSTTNGLTSAPAQVSYDMRQPSLGPQDRGQAATMTSQSVVARSQPEQHLRGKDADVLEFERQLNILSQSIDHGLPSAAPTPRPNLPPMTAVQPSAIAKAAAMQPEKEKIPMKRKDRQTSGSSGPPKKRKEQIQAEKAAAKEEKARAKAEKQKLQKEQAEQKKRDQAMKRAREEQTMKEIREKLALEDLEKERASADADRARAEEWETDKRSKMESNPGDNRDQNVATASGTPREVSLYPDTQAEVAFAQRELLKDAFVPRAPQPAIVNTPQFKPAAIGANSRNVTNGTSTQQTQSPTSASPFVYHVRPARSMSNPPSLTTWSAGALDKSAPAVYVAPRTNPLLNLSNSSTTTLEDNEEGVIFQKTPAPMQAKIVQSTTKTAKSLQPAVARRPSQKMQTASNSRGLPVSPRLELHPLSQSPSQSPSQSQSQSQSPSQSFPGVSPPTAQPPAGFKFSTPPEATSTPANFRANHIVPNPIIFAGRMDTPSQLLSQQSSQAAEPINNKSPPNDHRQTKRTFMSMNDIDSGNEEMVTDSNDFMTKMGLDLENMFGAGIDEGGGLRGAGNNTETTFQDAQHPLTMVSSPYGIGSGMTADEDKVLGNVLGMVEEWSRSLKWNIDEEAMRLGGPSSNSSGSES